MSEGLETYKKVKLLGKGSYGKAFLVTCGSDGVSNYKSINPNSESSMLGTCCDKEDRHKEDERRRLESHLQGGEDSRSSESPQYHQV